MTIEDRDYEFPNGKVGENYLQLIRPDYVVTLAIDKQDRIVVIRQYRKGVDDFVYELPSGWIEKSETPEQAASRELKEETGFEGKVTKMLEMYPLPGLTSMKGYLAIMELGEIQGSTNWEDDEEIEIELMKLDDVLKMLNEGVVKDMAFLSAMGVYLSSKN